MAGLDEIALYARLTPEVVAEDSRQVALLRRAKTKYWRAQPKQGILTGGFDAHGVNDCDGYRGWREAAFTSACILSSEGSAGRPM